MTEKSSLLGCEMIAIGGSNSCVPVRVLNITNETIKIHNHKTLGEFTEISNEDVLVSTVTEPAVGRSEYEDLLSRVNIDDQLTASQKVQLWELLKKHRLVFAGPENEGRTTTCTHVYHYWTKPQSQCHGEFPPPGERK